MFLHASKRSFFAVTATATASVFAYKTSCFCSSNDLQNDIRVIRAVVLFRHGDRSPIHPPHSDHILPTSAAEEETKFWSSKLPNKKECQSWLDLHPLSSPTQERIDAGQRPWGQLTLVGAYQARTLGQFLRERFINEDGGMLPSKLNNKNIKAHSTSIYRSQQTLQNVLIGLYGQGDREKGKETIQIHVTSNPDREEFQYSPNRDECSHLKKLHHVLTHKSAVHSLLTSDEQHALKKLQELFHFGDTKFPTTRVRSTLVCHRSHDHKLPNNVLPSDIRHLESANSKMEYKKYSNVNYFKLTLGRLIPRILNGLKGEDNKDIKLTLYSGHDSTIKPLAVQLGLDEMDAWPKYCANIIIEYGENMNDKGNTTKGEGYVRVLYNQNVTPVLGLKADENGWIPMKSFTEYMNRISITDHNHFYFCSNKHFGESLLKK
jgi:acid phosphatase